MDFDILFEAEVLRAFETAYRRKRSKYWFHLYLSEVFALVLKLKTAAILEAMVVKLAFDVDHNQSSWRGRFTLHLASGRLGPQYNSDKILCLLEPS